MIEPWRAAVRCLGAIRAKPLLTDQGFWGPFPGCLSRSSRPRAGQAARQVAQPPHPTTIRRGPGTSGEGRGQPGTTAGSQLQGQTRSTETCQGVTPSGWSNPGQCRQEYPAHIVLSQLCRDVQRVPSKRWAPWPLGSWGPLPWLSITAGPQGLRSHDTARVLGSLPWLFERSTKKRGRDSEAGASSPRGLPPRCARGAKQPGVGTPAPRVPLLRPGTCVLA